MAYPPKESGRCHTRRRGSYHWNVPSQRMARKELSWGRPPTGRPVVVRIALLLAREPESSYLGNSLFRAVNDCHPVVRGAGTASARSQPCGVRVAFGWTPIEASRAIAMLDLRETSG
jgi:hypothetical protein